MAQQRLFDEREPVEHDPDDTVWFGSSSFSTKDWVGPFYPEGTPPGDFLTYYATRFRTVEVDATYYAVPSRRTVAGWLEKVQEGFLLAAKTPKDVVHAGEGPKPDADKVLSRDHAWPVMETFLGRMEAMGPHMGPVLIQFPYFNRNAFPDAGPFLEKLDRFLDWLPDHFQFAVEVRNRAWVNEPLAELLRSHGAALTLVDHAWMPHGDEVAQQLNPLTTDWSYVRLIGDRYAIEEITTTWDREVLDRAESLARWADLLARLKREARRIVVYVNNHYAGHAPATLRRLRTLYAESAAE